MPTFTFTGKDNSLGLKHLHKYKLEPVKPTSLGEVRVRIHRPHGPIVVPYSSTSTFFHNWKRSDNCDSPSLNAYRKGCRCGGCTEMNREYMKHRRPTSSAEQFRKAVDTLIEHGVTVAEMCDRTGLSRSPFDTRYKTRTVQQDTLEKFREALPELREMAQERGKK